jgi:RimJ/RimL family protein N-acetyltransferase
MDEPALFDRLTWPVRTARLLLRPLATDDVPRLFAIRRQPQVARWLSSAPDDYDEFAAAFARPERMDTTLVMERDGVVVGDLYLRVSDAWGQREVIDGVRGTQAEIGWSVDPAYAGHGLATEGAAAVLRICFDGLGLRRVVAAAFADNAGSVRVMEKLGMTVEGRGRRDSLHRDLGWVDGITAAVLADEWRSLPDRPGNRVDPGEPVPGG